MKSLLPAIVAAFVVGHTLGLGLETDVMTAIECSQDCIKTGMSGGYFKDGQCWCYKPLKEMKSPTKLKVKTPCEPRCNKACVVSGWSGGVCQKDESCWCYDFGTGDIAEMAFTEVQPSPAEGDTLFSATELFGTWRDSRECNQNCFSAGMRGGHLEDGKCTCY